MKYSKELKAKVIARMMAPGNESMSQLSEEFSLPIATLYTWRKAALRSGVVAPGDGQNPEKWSGSAKFAVVLETASLPEAALSAYCRSKGLFVEQIRAWRAQCESAFESKADSGASRESENKRIRALERELRRKESALAETAALLVLRKKAAAIWGEKEAE
jgi:transposase